MDLHCGAKNMTTFCKIYIYIYSVRAAIVHFYTSINPDKNWDWGGKNWFCITFSCLFAKWKPEKLKIINYVHENLKNNTHTHTHSICFFLERYIFNTNWFFDPIIYWTLGKY